MATQITLITFNDPPIRLTCPRDALTAHSRVLADLLSLPSSAENDTSVEMHEAEEDLKPFVSVLCGKGMTELGELNEKGWETLARLGDKFDSETVKAITMGQAWKVYHRERSPLHVFALASFANTDNELLRSAALRVLDEELADTSGSQVLPEWLARLERWRLLLRLRALEVCVDPQEDFAVCNSCSHADARCCWSDIAKEGMARFKPSAPFSVAAFFTIFRSTLCGDCRSRMNSLVLRIEERFDAMPAALRFLTESPSRPL